MVSEQSPSRCRGCDALLSSYNRTLWCARCNRGPDLRLSQRYRDEVFARPEVVAALAEGDWAGFFVQVRTRTGLSQEALGRIVHLPQSSVSKIENGRHLVTDIRQIQQLVDALQIPTRLLNWPCGGSEPATPTAAAGPAQGKDDVAALYAAAQHLDAIEHGLGGEAAWPAGVAYARRARRLLERSTPGRDQRDLLAMYGWVCNVTASLLADARRLTESRQYFAEAMRVSRLADDRGLAVCIHLGLSACAASRGEHRESLRHTSAATAVQLVTWTPRLRALLLAREASALAGVSDPAGAVKAWRQAAHRFERGTVDEDSPGLDFFDRAAFAAYEARWRSRTGDLQQAVSLQRQAVAPTRASHQRDWFLDQLGLAELLVDADEVEEAASVAVAVAREAETISSCRIRHQLTGLASGIGALSQSPVARDLLELTRSDDGPFGLSHSTPGLIHSTRGTIAIGATPDRV